MHTRVVLGVVFILLKILAPSASQDYGSNLSDSSNITFTTPTSYNSIQAESTSQPISESTTIETSSTKVTASTTTTTTTQESVLDEFQLPENCSDYKVLTNQPQPSHASTIKKCCPMHQHYKYSNGKKFCTNSSVEFHIDVIQAKFYENCIEDEEKNLTMNVVTENNCKNGLVFNKNYFDMLYVIQNGSLLRIDADYESYDIYEHYCLDMDEDEGVLTAIVCEFDDVLFHVNRAQALIFATCMVISVPCLVITAALYLLVPELKDLHGKSLACHSLSMATGFFLLAFTQFRDLYSFEGHFIQFCLLACFFWLTVMWIDICLHAWYYLPKGIKQTSQDDNLHLMYYGLFAFGLSLILVILTYKNNLSGLPSYYIKGTTQVARTSQKFFIPPISISLIVNLFLYVSSYFGFKHKVQKIKITTFIALKLKQCAKDNRLSASYIADMEKVETIMKSTAYLTIIMTINWIFEIISFYNDTSSTFFDIINALQGVLIFLMFVCLPRPMKLIKHWYKDRGSFQVIDNDDNRPCNDIQMTSLTNTSEKQTD